MAESMELGTTGIDWVVDTNALEQSLNRGEHRGYA